MMVGRPVQLSVDKGRPSRARWSSTSPGSPSSTTTAWCSSTTCRFSVRGGEIYALAGVQGNGQTELTEALIGLATPTAGPRS